MKRNISPWVFITITVAIAPFFSAYSQSGSDPIKIRTEYYRSPATPDHIIFGTLATILSNHADNDQLGAAQQIQYRLGVSRDEAITFLEKLRVTHAAIRAEHDQLMDEMLCGQTKNRTRKQIYLAMDTLDDVRVLATQKHYMIFRQALPPDQATSLTEWLSAKKASHHHRRAKHESLYEHSGEDVIARLQQICAASTK
jgi:hypothetical protein